MFSWGMSAEQYAEYLRQYNEQRADEKAQESPNVDTSGDGPPCDLCKRQSTETWILLGPFPARVCTDADDCDAYRVSISRPMEVM
jgi:hypothetical protein